MTDSAVAGSNLIPLSATPGVIANVADPLNTASVGNVHVRSWAEIVFGLPSLGNSPVSWSGSALVTIVRVAPSTVTVTIVPNSVSASSYEPRRSTSVVAASSAAVSAVGASVLGASVAGASVAGISVAGISVAGISVAGVSVDSALAVDSEVAVELSEGLQAEASTTRVARPATSRWWRGVMGGIIGPSPEPHL